MRAPIRRVDLTAQPPTVHICGTIVVRTGVPVHRQDHPKTDSSTRTVAVPVFAADVLARLLDRVAAEPEEHLLFFSRKDTPLTPYNLRRMFRQVLIEAHLADREITPHSFRRTGATVISRGSDEDYAAKFLGHSSTAITRAHYIEDDVDAADPTAARILQSRAPGTV